MLVQLLSAAFTAAILLLSLARSSFRLRWYLKGNCENGLTAESGLRGPSVRLEHAAAKINCEIDIEGLSIPSFDVILHRETM